MVSLDPLNQLQSYLGRVATNLSAVGASGSEIPVAGGDLYTLAADQYGDAAAWPTIAQANGMTDPTIQGVQSIRIPPIEQPTDGVLTF
jgi:nucleoid-associated protein YgaU